MASMPAPALNAWKTEVTGVAGDATPALFESKIEEPHEDLSISGCALSLRHVGSELAPAGPECENVQNCPFAQYPWLWNTHGADASYRCIRNTVHECGCAGAYLQVAQGLSA